MSLWLLKTEPNTYSFADLTRDKKTTWDGITNNTALMHIRAMKKGDRVLIYHTGDERQAVGIAEVSSDPYPDPKAKNPKIVVFDIKPKQLLKHPVSLDAIKTDKTFEGFDLLRIGRLSVVPVPEKMWKRIEELSSSARPS